jgi:hypothetical protein
LENFVTTPGPLIRHRALLVAGFLVAHSVGCSSNGAAPRSTGDAGPGSGGNAAGGAGNGNGGAANSGGANASAGGSSSGGAGGRSAGGGTAGTGGSAGASGSGATAGAGGSTPDPTCTGSCTADCTQGCFDLGSCAPKGGGGKLDLEPNVVTLGVVLTTSAGADTGNLFYRKAGSATWWKGPGLVRTPDGTLAGSAFGLAPDTSYEVRVDVATTTACGTATTEALDPVHATASELWVDAAAAAGGDGSTTKPYAHIQDALAKANAGDDVRVRTGLYRESVTLPRSGAEGKFIRLLGEPGAILDGSAAGSLTWKDEGGGVASTAWTGDPRYVSRDGQRLYHFTSLDDLKSGTGYNNVPIAEGFYVDGGRLYVRTTDGPSGHTFQIPEKNTAISIAGQSWVWVQGLEIRYYGDGDYAKGIDVTETSSHVVIRKNHVHDIPTNVWIRKASTQVRIEDNDLHQSTVFSWPWDAVKATDHENDAITLAGGRGTIVARNTIHDVFNGVYAGSFDDDHNPALAFDVDVYENRLARIGDDGFEPEGACVNARFHDNVVDRIHNGVSMAPITYGPTWVVRNRFTNYQESGFKVSNDTSGRVWLLHNTCYTDDPDHNGMNVSGAFSNIVFRNNVVRGTSYAIESTQVVGMNDLDYDAWFTTRGAPRVKWDNVRYDDLAALCAATTLECHGVGADPKLDAPASFRFAPATGSPLIDAAERLYGINDDYAGKGPDIGYVEQGGTEVPAL